MRGTGYAIAEIIWWMLAAALIGLIIGWLIARMRSGGVSADEWEARLAAERSKTAKVASDLDDRTKLLDGVKAELSGAKTKIGEIEGELSTRGADLEAATARVSDLESKVSGLSTDLEGANAKVAGIADLEATVGSREAAIGDLEGKVGTLSADLDAARSRVGSLEAELAAAGEAAARLTTADGRIGELEAALASAEAQSSGEVADLRAKLDAAHAKVADLEGRLEGSGAAAARVTELQAELDTSHGRINELELRLSECAEARSDLEDKIAAAAAPAAVGVAELPDKETATAKVAEIAARTRGAGPRVDDDLKKIHGVGPKLERLLKSMDITSFRQVALFTTDDIAYVTAALDAFPGRIERDDWMQSAADEHQSKYSEDITPIVDV